MESATSIYVVKSVNEGYGVYKEDVLVTTDKVRALKEARKTADYSYKGSELNTWENGVLINTEHFSDRADTTIIFDTVPIIWSDYSSTSISKAIEEINEGLNHPLILIKDSSDFKEYLTDYNIQVEFKEMTFEEYKEAYSDNPEKHYIACDYWDSTRLPEVKEV